MPVERGVSMKLKWENDGSIKTPTARARGLGSAHEGAGHWWELRATAVAGIPLVLWLVWSVVHIENWTHEEFTRWLAQPVNAVLMIVSVLVLFFHGALGSQEVVEDYVHHKGIKVVKLIGMQLLFFAGAVACIFSVLKIAFTAG